MEQRSGDVRYRLLLLAAALVAGGAGQFYLLRRPVYSLDAVVFYLVSVACFLAAAAPAWTTRPRLKLPSQPRQPGAAPLWASLPSPRRIARGAGLVAAGAILIPLAGDRNEIQESPLGFWPLFFVWVTGIAAFVGSYATGPERARAWGERLRHSWREWLPAALVMILALALRVWRIDSIPWTVGGDEGSQGLWGRLVLNGSLRDMFYTGWLSVPNMSFFWQALWLEIAGDNVVGLRLPWALIGTATVLGSYLVVRRVWDEETALLTAFLLATYHYHIHFSRLGSNQIADPFFVVWMLYFLLVGWQGRRPWAFAAAGVVAGIAIYFYAGARLVPLLLVVVTGLAALFERGFLRRNARGLAAMLGGLAAAAGPMVLFAIQHPDDFNARLNQVGIFQSGWLDAAVAAGVGTRAGILADQVRRAFGAFHLYLDRTSWYAAAIPLMEPVAAVFFTWGLALACVRLARAARMTHSPHAVRSSGGSPNAPHRVTSTGLRRAILNVPAGAGRYAPRATGATPPALLARWGYGVMLLWLLLVLVTGGVLTESPPSSQRLVGTAVPAIFCLALGVQGFVRAASGISSGFLTMRALNLAAICALLAVLGVRYYFGPYQEGRSYGNFNAEVATRVGYYLRDLPGGRGWTEYWFGAPRIYADFGSVPFLAPEVWQSNVDRLSGPVDFVDRSRNAVFLFLPERIADLRAVQAAFPQGYLEDVYRNGDPSAPLLFTAYRVEFAGP